MQEEVDLHDSDLNSSSVPILCEFIKSASSMHTLDLSHNPAFTVEDAMAVTKALAESDGCANIEVVNFSSTAVHTKGEAHAIGATPCAV